MLPAHYGAEHAVVVVVVVAAAAAAAADVSADGRLDVVREGWLVRHSLRWPEEHASLNTPRLNDDDLPGFVHHALLPPPAALVVALIVAYCLALAII